MSNKIIGFTQGTFDMFHIGHLNLLQNAKKQCDHLIVGVNTDKLVMSYKNIKPFTSLKERIKIVGAIRYVDEILLCNTLDKEYIWIKKNYHKLFIGDDWRGSDRWNQTEKALKEYHVKVIYLPYTKSICSTIMRERLYNAILNENTNKRKA